MLTWIQIPSSNLARASKFYEDVFNASFLLETLNNIPHAIFKKNKIGIKLLHGAIIEVSKNNFGGGPILFFDATGNFETIMELIEANGGKITHAKTLITNMENEDSYTIPNTYIDDKPGYYAHFIDCEGNKMGLYGTN